MEVDVNVIAEKPIKKEISIDAYKVFSQSDYYSNIWQRIIKGESSFYGFNPSAALFGITWCFYRKLYILGVFAFIASFLVMAVAAFLVEKYSLQSERSILTLLGLIILIRTPLGFLANFVYFKKANKIIVQCVNSRMPEDYFGSALKVAGGVSIGAVFAFIGFNAILKMLSDFLL